MSIRVGVIGASFAKKAFLPALTVISDAEVVAIASARMTSAKDAAEAFGVTNFYDNWQAMLAQHEFDLICIATPTNMHAPMAIAAMEAGAHVLCEKPTAMNVVEVQRMVDTAERLDRLHMVDHELRFNPNRRKAQQLIAEGVLGQVNHAHVVSIGASWSNPASRPKGDWWSSAGAGGGRLGANGSHQIDMLRWWLGEVTEVCGEVLTMVPDRVDKHTGETWTATADDVAHLMLYTERDTLATVFMSGVARHNFGNHTQVFGSEGTLLLSNEDERLLLARGDGPLEDITVYDPHADLPGINKGIWNVSVVGLLKEFTAAIREGRAIREGATLYDGLETQRVMDAVRLSTTERRWIKIER